MNVLDLTKRLDDIFGPVSGERGAGYFAEFNRQLSRYQGPILAQAYSDVMDDWTKTIRPTPATFRQACSRHVPSAPEATGGRSKELEVRERGRKWAEQIKEGIRDVIKTTFEHGELEIRAAAGDRWTAAPYRMRHLEISRPALIMEFVRAHIARRLEPIIRRCVTHGETLPYVYEFTEEDWHAIWASYDAVGSHFAMRTSAFVTMAGAMDGSTNRRGSEAPYRPVARAMLPAPDPAPPVANDAPPRGRAAASEESPSTDEPAEISFADDEIDAF